MNKPFGYIDVDRLQAETTFEAAASKCGVSLDVKGTGAEVRIDCPFRCDGDHAGRKEMAINTENPQKIFQCHSYQCGFRGNLLTLMHGFLTGSKPTGGKLKGDEFQRVKKVLAGTSQADVSRKALVAGSSNSPSSPSTPSPKSKLLANTPLLDSTEERVRELHNIDEKLIRDVASMNPVAAVYIRRHPCLSPESMAKWRCGYLPQNGGDDKRGWSLRGSILYPVLSEQGKVLAWVGRDVQYEQKEKEYQQLSAAERSGKEPPAKHRFPKGFHRGLELFGQQASRLKEPGYREFIQKHGLILVEGFNDVINLDNLGIPALGILSNRMTEEQGKKIIHFARQLGINRVNLMFDCDEPGTAGAKEALWFFAEQQVEVHLVWSPTMHNSEFDGAHPESIAESTIAELLIR